METRRIVLDGEPADVVRDGEELVAEDGRRLPADEAVHLPPVQPTKIVCVVCRFPHRYGWSLLADWASSSKLSR